MKQLGFSLILIMCIMTALSTLLLQLYTRSSYVLLTVKEREHTLQLTYATHTLMLYAIHMAKYNWDYIIKEGKGESLTIDNLLWHITQDKQGKGTCVLKKKDNEHLSISVELNHNNYSRTVKCDLEKVSEVEINNGVQVIIRNWKIE